MKCASFAALILLIAVGAYGKADAAPDSQPLPPNAALSARYS
jgi:hypothetical protein